MRAYEILNEDWKNNAAVAALIAALSTPAQAYENPPQPEPSIAAKALSIYRMANRYKNYNDAALQGEATQELHNILRSIQGHPNQSKLLPVIRDIIKSSDTEELPPLTSEQP